MVMISVVKEKEKWGRRRGKKRKKKARRWLVNGCWRGMIYISNGYDVERERFVIRWFCKKNLNM